MNTKSILCFALLLFYFSCGEPQKRTSRNTPFCECEHEIDGKSKRLEIADQEVEEIFDFILNKAGINPRAYKLCYARMKKYAGMALHRKGINYIYIDPDDMEDASHYYKGTNWYTVFVLCHEIGHHIHNHGAEIYLPDSQHEDEADMWAGFMLYQLTGDINKVLMACPFEDEASARTRQMFLQGIEKVRFAEDLSQEFVFQ